MSEQSRRRTWDVKRNWQPVAEVNAKPHNCSVCGQADASYSVDGGWNWHCWKCVPDNKDYERANYAQTSN